MLKHSTLSDFMVHSEEKENAVTFLATWMPYIEENAGHFTATGPL